MSVCQVFCEGFGECEVQTAQAGDHQEDGEVSGLSRLQEKVSVCVSDLVSLSV